MVTAPITVEDVETALRRVPPQRWPDVLTFIEFLECQAAQEEMAEDADEDAELWQAVEKNQAYKAGHPGEMIIHESGEDFLAATADL